MARMKRFAVKFLTILTCTLSLFGTPAGAAGTALDVPPASNLRLDAQTAEALSSTVLLVFVADHCGYCEIVLHEFLIPMSRNPEYAKRVVMRRIVLNSDLPLYDFDGARTTHEKFARRINVRMTPIVQMFDTRGLLLGKPVVGFTIRDYYGELLDRAIDGAIAQVQDKKKRAATTPSTGAL